MNAWLRRIAKVVIIWATAAPLLAQTPPPKHSQEAITLDLDSAASKRLAHVEDFVANQQWDQVAALLRQTQAEKPDKLVAIAPGWYVSVVRFCQCQSAVLPPAGLAAYRQQVEGTAKKWLDDAERWPASDPQRQRAEWLRIVRQSFASSAADEALARLAEQSFEQGDFATARTYWEQLLPAPGSLRATAGLGLPRHPDSSFDAAQIRAQLVLCSLFAGDAPRTELERSAFRRLHGNAIGRLAGREGVLIDLLSEISDRQPRSTRAEPNPSNAESRMWGVRLPAPTWATSPVNVSNILPAIADDSVFATNGEAVFAFDRSSGRPKWSAEPNADAATAAIIYSWGDPFPPKRPVQGHSWHSLTVHEDRLYARLGSPITGKARQETNLHSELVGLDVGQAEGKLVWRVSAADIDPQDPLHAAAPWCFEGAPVANAQRVFAVLRRSLPQEQINVACFDADTASILWNRKIGVTVASTDEAVNSTSHLQPTLAEDSLFVSTDSGAIAALDARDGAIRWLRTYESDATSSRERRHAGHTPPMYHAGVLYVAPLDTNVLFAIHAESGLLLWQREWPDPIQHLLGVCEGTLIVQGRSLWGVSLANGTPAWPNRRVGDDDPEGSSFGRGLLADHEVWWPNREELLVVAANSGQIKRRWLLNSSLGQSGGHLTGDGRSLVVSGPERLTNWGELWSK
jgi:hypothetical protein